jgi:hypothetical protein
MLVNAPTSRLGARLRDAFNLFNSILKVESSRAAKTKSRAIRLPRYRYFHFTGHPRFAVVPVVRERTFSVHF